MIRKVLVVALVMLGSSWQLSMAQPTQGTAATGTAGSQSNMSLEGEWQGTLDAGGSKLRLALKVAKSAEGKFTGTLVSLDQNATGIPISSIDQSGNEVTLQLIAIGGSYAGKMNAASMEIAGEWKQGRQTLPLVFKRSLPETAAKPPTGPPASLAGFEDEASFSLLVNEEALGVMKSSWKKDGSFNAQATITVAGQSRQASTRITPDAEGRWSQIVIEAATGTATLTRQGSSVTRTVKDKTTTWETRDGVLLYDNNAPALMSQTIRAYDRKKGGAQKLPLLGLPGVGMDLTLEAKETAEHAVAGKDLALTKFLYGLPGVDLYVFADSTGKIYLVDIPAQKASFVREGYEGLRKAAASDPLLSAPKYEVQVDHGVSVPMRDGVKLSADIYRPQGVEKAPVILVRTPYKKEMAELAAKFYARRG